MAAAKTPAKPRTLHLTNPPMHGPDVLHLQRALKAAGVYKGKLDGSYSAATAHACELMKFRLGYPKAMIHAGHEVAGPLLIAFLAGQKKLPLPYRLLRAKRIGKPAHAPAATPTKHENAAAAARKAIVGYWEWAIAHEPDIHYAEIRPMTLLDRLQALPQTNDCSTEATKGTKFAGLPDPNGFGYNGLGYTGTLMHHCRIVSQAQALAGDLAIFGQYPGHHVVTLLEDGVANGRNPWCGSHGQERGPMKIRLKTEAQYQPAGITFLQVVA